MKRHRLRPMISMLLLVVMAATAFGLWGRFPNDKPISENTWPQPIVKAINAHRRVYGAGSWDFGWDFYFHGDSDDANLFLAQVAEEKVAVLDVVLVPEPGIASVMSEPLGKDLKIAYEWSIHLYPYRDQLSVERRAGESNEQLKERLKQFRANSPEFGATVTVHCTAPIDQTALKLPLRFSASVGGRLANLANFHNQRRSELQKEGKLVDDGEPTNMSAAEAPRDFFNGPTTRPATGKGG